MVRIPICIIIDMHTFSSFGKFCFAPIWIEEHYGIKDSSFFARFIGFEIRIVTATHIIVRLSLTIHIVSAKEGEHDREKEQPVKESKHDHQRNHVEECGKGVRLRKCKWGDGQKGWQAAVQDCGADVRESIDGTLSTRALGYYKRVCYVGAVVNAEANPDHKAVHSKGIYYHAPRVNYTHNIYNGEQDTGQGEDANSQVV